MFGIPVRQNKMLQYWAVFVGGKPKPIALFEKHDVAVMFKETMTEGTCEIRPFCFWPEGDK